MITYTQLHKTGRLGNQLFQLASCIATALRNNDSYIFPHWEYEPYFNLHNCYSNNINQTIMCEEPHFHFAEIPYFNTKNDVLDISGYRQSYRYFDNFKSEIVRLFTPIHHFDKTEELCSIHVRRTDYLNLPDHHPTQSMAYYEKAMELSKCNKFIVLSDDISWCKNNFKGNQFEFSEGNPNYIDLAIMAKKCSSNIICNSSFSWWGAYLNQNPYKIVIAPQNWFGYKLPHNTQDLCPPEWIKI